MGPKTRARILKELRRKLEMGSCVFDQAGEGAVAIERGGVTDFIRQRTRVWRETWILTVLDEVIQADEEAAKR